MSDDPLSATATTQDTTTSSDDDLEDLLAQADSMISEAANANVIVDGFAIDSDDEDDADIVDVSISESPIPTGRSVMEGGGNPPPPPPVDPLLHPLHEDVPAAAVNTKPNPAATGSGSGYAAQMPDVGATAANAAASLTSAMRNFGVSAGVGGNVGGGAAIVGAGATTGVAAADQLRAQTSRFAANFSNMAQRAATAVSSVTPTHHDLNANFEGNVPPPMSVPAGMNGMMYPANGMMGQQPQAPYTPNNSSNNSSPYASQTNSSHGMNNNNVAMTPQQPMINIELDAEQKTALVELHVKGGKLLPGEKVIMFLHNLLHVSDSTGFQYAASPQTSSTVWCCAMTYYRLILFGTTQEMIVHIMNTVVPATTPAEGSPTNSTADASSTPNKAAQPKDEQSTRPPMLQHPYGIPDNWNRSCWQPAFPTVLEIPLASMEKVEKTVYTAPGASSSTPTAGGRATTLMGLQIWAKQQRFWRLTTPNYADTLKAHQAILTYAFPGRRNLGYLFAFESKRADVVNSVVVDPSTGQKTVALALFRRRFEPVAEFQRQFGTAETSADATGNTGALPKVQPWKIFTQLNGQYQLCQSYPSVLVGPASLDENNPDAVRLLQNCAAFRSEQRLPALAWGSGIDGASIWRCSQPKIGLQGNRSSADELVLKHIMEAAKSANALREQPLPVRMNAMTMAAFTGSNDLANSHWVKEAHCALKILDLRPRSAAMANRTGGYGYENTSNYPGTTLQFCDIGNIHAVRGAYQKMSALCLNMTNSADVNWGSAIEDTKWLSHIRIILAASWETAFWVHVHRMPVLLHCSHGWDRTSQVSALAQLMLDPYYRTMEGFACLMEKDFMSFGHPFHTRCAHGEGKGGNGNDRDGGAGGAVGLVSGSDGNSSVNEGQISPIFLQFLDCVWQMVNQYPECFEFTTAYLLELSDHIYSCRFGNMLCDTERERELVAGIRQRTRSVWDYMEQEPDDPNGDPNAKLWKNEYFSPTAGGGVLLMPMPTLLRNVTLWTERYAQFGPMATIRWK